MSEATATVAESWVDVAVTGERMPCFVAAPASPRGGVVVIQEIFGVNADMQRIARLLAGEGYLAVAPAMFHRTDPDFDAPHDAAGVARGRAAMAALTFEQLRADLAAATGFLRERLGDGKKIATWGFCFGGSVAYFSATMPEVAAAVSFYGRQIAYGLSPSSAPIAEVTPEIHAPLLLAFGADDDSIPAEAVASIREALERANATFDLRVFAGVGHAFFREGPEGNDASREVWPLVTAFLARNLAAA